jgi:hypothetical protein
MGDKEALKDFPDQRQRAAVCGSQFRTDGILEPGPTEDVQRTDAIRLPPIERTDEGFLIAPGTRIARTGVQEYTTDDGLTQRELRLPEEIFNPASLKTLNGKPVVYGHPNEPVTVANARALMRGTVSAARKDETDGKFVAADIVIHDGNTIHAADRGDARELSAGYRTMLVPVPGGVHRKDGCPYDGTYADVYQTKIKYNHLALLPAGRANEGTRDRPVRLRLDGAGNQLFADEERPKMATIKINGKDVEVSQEVADEHAKQTTRADAAEAKAKPPETDTGKLKELEDRIAKSEARADEAEAKLKKQEEEANSDEKVKADAALFELRKQAETKTKLKGDEIMSLDAAGLRREILKAVAPNVPEEKLKNDEYVEARLDMITEGRNSATSLRDPTRQDGGSNEQTKDDGKDSPLAKAFQERSERNNAGFKTA